MDVSCLLRPMIFPALRLGIALPLKLLGNCERSDPVQARKIGANRLKLLRFPVTPRQT